jgi:hypothetical protein
MVPLWPLLNGEMGRGWEVRNGIGTFLLMVRWVYRYVLMCVCVGTDGEYGLQDMC